MKRLAALLVGLLLAPTPCAWAAPRGHAGAQARYWVFSDHNDLRDVLAYWAPGPFHVQLEIWDFLDPETDDQFRPEVGLHVRDARKSVYTLQVRHERKQERFWIGTDQVLGAHLVGRAELSPIVSADSTLWVWSVGADYYWGSYNFLAATVIRDPRGDDLWVVPVRARWASESNDWLQVTLAPASQRSFGWAVDGKRGWLRLGIERNSRYDFTSRDNTVFTAGFEVPLGRPE
ncbi:MAG TPA: hypothetical protein VEY91_04990 [Candidatus Limnocylindria bacterium]|nr:hypothetical protein [Candidatus Limnocylindria bacterium]